MNLRQYLDKTKETIANFALRANLSTPMIRDMWHERRTPLFNTAIAIEHATEGKVNALDMMGTLEGYKPLDPEWLKWWESRPGAAERAEVSPIPDRKPRAHVA
jgi:hypothetical protein